MHVSDASGLVALEAALSRTLCSDGRLCGAGGSPLLDPAGEVPQRADIHADLLHGPEGRDGAERHHLQTLDEGVIPRIV